MNLWVTELQHEREHETLFPTLTQRFPVKFQKTYLLSKKKGITLCRRLI